MKWNLTKLEKMLERNRALNLALRDLSDRVITARARGKNLQTEIDEYSTPTARMSLDRFKVRTVPPHLLADREKAEVEYQRLAAACSEAEQHWQQYGAVVANLRQFAEQNLGYRGAK